MKSFIITLLVLTIYTTNIYGQTNPEQSKHPIDIELQKCLDTGNNMMGCEEKAYQAWDKELNKQYQILMSLLTDTQKEKLSISQRNWIKWRDNEITFTQEIYPDTLGQVWAIGVPAKKTDMTRQRTQELISYIENIKMIKKEQE